MQDSNEPGITFKEAIQSLLSLFDRTFQNAHAIHVTQNEASLLFVSCNDTLQIWNGIFKFNSVLIQNLQCHV